MRVLVLGLVVAVATSACSRKVEDQGTAQEAAAVPLTDERLAVEIGECLKTNPPDIKVCHRRASEMLNAAFARPSTGGYGLVPSSSTTPHDMPGGDGEAGAALGTAIFNANTRGDKIPDVKSGEERIRDIFRRHGAETFRQIYGEPAAPKETNTNIKGGGDGPTSSTGSGRQDPNVPGREHITEK